MRGDSSGTKKKGSARLGSMAEALKTRQAERRKGLSSKALSATDVAAVKGSMEKRMTVGQRKHMDGLKKAVRRRRRNLPTMLLHTATNG